MKANELRIGNYVFSAEDNKTGEVLQIDSSGIIFANKNGNRWQDLKNIQPISLTEETLLKCGFEGGLKYCYLEKDQFCIECNNGVIGLLCGQYAESPQELPIKYLHQLQNLYFALTGRNLK